MHLSCYIVDDEYHSIEVLARYIEKSPGLILSGSATNPLHALEEYSGGKSPDITFLDVDMPELNGLDMAGLIGPATSVIFTTSFREYAPEAFEKNAVDYLLKPIDYARFLTAVNKVQQNLRKLSDDLPDHFFVKTSVKGKFHRVDIPAISHIENIGNYVIIHSVKDKITAYLTLAEVLTKLPESNFSRIHQSFIVNHSFIQSLEYGQVRLGTGLNLPVGGTYRSAFREKMQKDILTSKRDIRST